MSDLLAARAQMALSLGFHIVFAVVGMAMPLLMVLAEGLYLRTREPVYLELARRWAKGTAILFAVGAVSGTVLSFELGLLWPTFMQHAGPVIGMPFSLEGFAFFLEAIFLGVYLYGWNKVSPTAHWVAGWLVLLGGTSSGVFVVAVNAWMNTPAGVTFARGVITDIRPWQALLNPAAPTQAAHMVIAAFQSVGAVVASIHAVLLLRRPGSAFHRRALAIAGSVAAVFSLLQPLSGDFLARQVARNQPVKLAAMEDHWRTRANAPLSVGPLVIPSGLSLLAYHDADAVVLGLADVPERDRPPVRPVRLAFQFMVGAGTALAATSALGFLLAWRARGLPRQRWFLKLVAAMGPLGLLALEAGWVVTEVGRQPWIIQGFMRTAQAVTPVPGLAAPLALFTLVYVLLATTVLVLLRRLVFLEPVA